MTVQFHPATISARLQGDGPPPQRRVSPTPVLDERWRARIAALVETYPRLLGVSVHNKLRAEGFEDGYSGSSDSAGLMVASKCHLGLPA